ncbi:MAG TPA: fatty acid desaturase [Stellaceae bacterium]|nr:fatty acid desaturase [Stellaceae bacterium]
MEAPPPTAKEADAEGAGRGAFAGEDEALPIARLRQALDDLFTPNPILYWLDFVASALCFYGGLALVAATPLSAPLKLAAFAVSALGLYRALIFTHELAHFPPRRMRAFRIAWNLACGFPLLAPDFLYETHVDHHRRASYGTAHDGEYLPWGRPGGRPAILMFLVSSLLALPACVVRFGILAPLSWLMPNLRRWVAIHASSLVVDNSYCRTPPTPVQDRRWRRHEAIAFLYLCAVIAGLSTGLIPAAWIVLLYLTLTTALLLNGLRTLAAHRYRSAGTPLTMTKQLLDSLNYPRQAWLNELWAPVGLRFHAVHHLFPGIPYHNLAAAHARLSRLLPSDSPYHRTEARGLITSVRELWRAARADPATAAALTDDRPAELAE